MNDSQKQQQEELETKVRHHKTVVVQVLHDVLMQYGRTGHAVRFTSAITLLH